MFTKTLVSLLALATSAFATCSSLVDPLPKITNCSIPADSLVFNSTQLAALGAPPSVPAYVGLSLGTNNYTCNTTSNTWTNVGVYSVLLDISCLVKYPSVLNYAEKAWQNWNNSDPALTVDSYVELLRDRPVNTTRFPIELGLHTFVNYPAYGPAIYPAFDFTGYTGNPNSTVTLVKVASWDDGNAADVPWLQVNRIDHGGLVSKIFRVNTRGGMPPTSCKAGDKDMTVRYSGIYWMYA